MEDGEQQGGQGGGAAAGGAGGGAGHSNIGETVARSGESTQRFSALQEQLLCAAIHFFHRHIRSDQDVLQRMEGNNMFRLFYEVKYHNKPDLNRIFPESVHDCSALHVCSFILSILHQGIFSVSAFIVSVIYLSRFKESSHITLHACTWRPLFLTSLLLADKMWEDKPVRNSSLAKLFPVLSNLELNRMESDFLGEIKYNVLVKPDLFCSFCEKLLAEQVHVEITRCVNSSEYAATLQADHVETAPVKPAAKPAPEAPHTSNVSLEGGGNYYPNGNNAETAQRGSAGGANGGRQGQVAAWMESNGPSTAGVPTVQTAGVSDAGVVPRSHSAGPTTSAGSRRGENTRLSNDPRSGQPIPTLVSLRGIAPGGDSAPPSAKSTTSHQARSVSGHPLHRTESQKKHLMGKAEDAGEKSARPVPQPAAYSHSGPPLRRSLPAKTSSTQYQPHARAPSSGGNREAPPGAGGAGATGSSGPVCPVPSGSLTAGAGPSCGSSNATAAAGASGGGAAVRQPPQSSPRSPGSVSPVLVPHDQNHPQPSSRMPAGGIQAVQAPQPNTQDSVQAQPQTHAGRSNSHPRVTSAPAGPGRHGPGNKVGCASVQAQRVATPPMPLASHSGPPGQVHAHMMGKGAAQPSRGTSPGGTVQQQHQQIGGQPARASSAPRVAGLGAHLHGHATPPGSSSMRTAGSQPAQQTAGVYHQHQRQPAAHAPSSPSVKSPMGAGQISGSPFFPQHHGTPGSVVVFPASPAHRGTSPAPGVGMVGGIVPMNSSRGVSSTSGIQRNASPMGIVAPASPAGATNACAMSPAGQISMNSMSVQGAHQRPELLSTARGRSPPPGVVASAGSGPSTVRAPRAVTPGGIVKSIAQSTGGTMNVHRNSFGGGPMVIHRGIG